MTGSKTILCSTRNSDRIRLSKIILGNRSDPFRRVFELKGGHLKLWWERFWLRKIFWKEIRWNEELMIILSICTFAFCVDTDVSNKWYRKIWPAFWWQPKSRLYFERNYFLRSVSFRLWANCFPYKSFMLLSSGLPCITGIISRAFHSSRQMHEACANGESFAQKITE